LREFICKHQFGFSRPVRSLTRRRRNRETVARVRVQYRGVAVHKAGDRIVNVPCKDPRLDPAVCVALQDYALIIMGADGTVQSWSEGAETIFGYTTSEVAGCPVAMLFSPEDQARGAPAGELATAAREGRAEDERWHVRKGGTRIWLTGTVRALRDDNGEVRGFVKLAREVTTKKFAEIGREAKMQRVQQARAELERVNTELQAEGERLAVEIRERQRAEEVAKTQASRLAEQAALLDLAQDAIFVVEMDSTIIYWNKGAEKMYGWTKQEALGRNVHELLRTESSAPLQEIRGDLVQTGQWFGEIKHYSRSGQGLNVLVGCYGRKMASPPAGWKLHAMSRICGSWKSSCGKRRSWKASACSPEESRMISTTSSPESWGTSVSRLTSGNRARTFLTSWETHSTPAKRRRT
jgi:PAS domain S-box-containing protein